MFEEYDIELAAIKAIEEDNENLYNKVLECYDDIERINKFGVTRGYMIAFEASKTEDEAPLELPLEMFTEMPSMSCVDIATEGLKSRASKLFSEFLKGIQKAAITAYKFIIKVLKAIAGKTADKPDTKEAYSAEKVQEELKKVVTNKFLYAMASSAEIPDTLNLIMGKTAEELTELATFNQTFFEELKKVATDKFADEYSMNAKTEESVSTDFNHVNQSLEVLEMTFLSKEPLTTMSATNELLGHELIGSRMTGKVNMANKHGVLNSELEKIVVRQIKDLDEDFKYDPFGYQKAWDKKKEVVEKFQEKAEEHLNYYQKVLKFDSVEKVISRAESNVNDMNSAQAYVDAMRGTLKQYGKLGNLIAKGNMAATRWLNLYSTSFTIVWSSYISYSPELNK